MTATERKFRDIETGKVFDLFIDETTKSNYKLIYTSSNLKDSADMANGSEVNGSYIAAGYPMTIKLNSKKIVYLPRGTFYNVKEGEEVTHRKYEGFKRFIKA